MDKLLTAKEAADYLKVSDSTVRRSCKRGLPHIKKTFGLRFKKEDLEKWLEQDKREIVLACNILKNALTNSPLIAIDEVKGDKSKLAKKSQTCFNYGFGSIYTRKTKSGKFRWYVYYYDEIGNRVRKVIPEAETKAQALAILEKKILDVLNKKNAIKSRSRNIRFGDFSQIYLRDYIMVTRRNFQSDLYRLKKLEEYYNNYDLREITPLMIEKFRASRLKVGNTKSTTNRYLALLKRMFNLAIQEGYLEENPVKKLKLHSEKDNLQERVLTEEEERRLFKTSSGYLKSILIIALNTGMRLGEILSLRWNQIDFTNRKIKVEKTKSGKVRFVNINTPLLEELLKLRNRIARSPFIFFNPKTSKPLTTIKKSFKTACSKARIEGLRFHDLRHTFGSRLVERGVDLITVKELLGHSTVKITERYTHSNQDQKRKAVDLLALRPTNQSKNKGSLTHFRHTDKKKTIEEKLKKLPTPYFSMN